MMKWRNKPLFEHRPTVKVAGKTARRRAQKKRLEATPVMRAPRLESGPETQQNERDREGPEIKTLPAGVGTEPGPPRAAATWLSRVKFRSSSGKTAEAGEFPHESAAIESVKILLACKRFYM
jgi:hypothetical protein